MAEHEQNHYAFLSCCAEDNLEAVADSTGAGRRSWGNWLEDALKAYAIPPEFVGQINGRGEIIPERISSVYRDESELPEDGGLSVEARRALEQTNCLVVICSPRSAQSRQVNEVVRYFKQLGRAHQILPFVISGKPNADNSDQSGAMAADECYVPALRHPLKPDGSLDTARLASKHIFVDARHGSEKREILAQDHGAAAAELERAKIQLFALLLGVGFDVLWVRQQKFHFLELMEAQEQARETLNQVAEVRQQLREAQEQAREVQRQALEQQHLPRAIQEQIQEAQHQAATAQQQARAAQERLQEVHGKVRETQAQLEEARNRARVAEGKVLEAQQAARETQAQLEAVRNQVRATQEQALEVQSQTQAEQSQDAQNQLLAAQREAQNAQGQLEEARHQAQLAQSQLAEVRQQLREVQGKVEAAENQAHEALNQVQEIQNQTRDAQSQIKAAQEQARTNQDRERKTRRFATAFAVLAAVALLVVGVVARNASQQRELDRQALAKAAAEASGTFEPVAGGEPVRQVLQKIGGATQDENRRASLDRIAAGIPIDEIPEVLRTSSVMVDAQQRSRFQRTLLMRLGGVNPMSAMTNAGALEGKFVNEQGERESSLYLQLAVLDNWLQADWPEAFSWVCQLPDASDRQRAVDKVIRSVQAQPDSEGKDQRLVNCVVVLAKTDLLGALALAETLPTGNWFEAMIALACSTDIPMVVRHLWLPPEIMLSRNVSWPWSNSLPNVTFGCPAIFLPDAAKISPNTNGPVQALPQE